jgi:hypothetical protein
MRLLPVVGIAGIAGLLLAASAGALGGGRVTLLTAEGEGVRPELSRLAADLDRAAAEMAARLPPAPNAPPVRIAVAADFVAQAKDTGEIGPAVIGGGGRVDITLVYHPDDLFADRYAVAQVLLARSGVVSRQPLWIARGAALQLSGDWYGRSWRDWLPRLAAARALPTAEQLLATEEQPDASAPLWTPVAAAVVDRLPGKTLAEKLARPLTPAAVTAILQEIQRLPAPPALPAPPTSTRFLKGVSLAMSNRLEGGYHAPGLDDRLGALAKLGVDAVSLMPFAFQEAPDRPRLVYLNRRPESETDAGLVHAARRAAAHGMAVLYKPHIWVGRDSWPGDVAMTTEADWATWWTGYRRFILHHALLAGFAKADLLSVGCELAKTTGRTAEWRDLIAAVRLLYPGRLTYAANWGGDFEQVAFWDRLDVAGVDAYYPLTASSQANAAELAAGARKVVDHLEIVARRAGKSLLLTEVGFAASAGAWTAPHKEGGTYSEEDQAAAYSALFNALDHRPWLAGTFVWKTFSGGDGGRQGRADFRFLGRQAEGVVRKYYGR